GSSGANVPGPTVAANMGSSRLVTWGYLAEAACQAATIWASDGLRARTCWTRSSTDSSDIPAKAEFGGHPAGDLPVVLASGDCGVCWKGVVWVKPEGLSRTGPGVTTGVVPAAAVDCGTEVTRVD